MTTKRPTETNKRTEADKTNKQQNPVPRKTSRHISVEQATKEGGHPHPLSYTPPYTPPLPPHPPPRPLDINLHGKKKI